MKNKVNYGTMATDGEGAPHLASLGSRPIMVAAAKARESAYTVHHHGEGTVHLANVATKGGAADAEDSNSSDSSGESADEGAVPRRDIQLDERGVAGYLLEVVNILGEHPHAFESLKELVDRHPQSLQRVGGPPHPPWPLRKGLAAAEGRVESRKPTPPRDRDASRHAPHGSARGGERNGGGAAGDTAKCPIPVEERVPGTRPTASQ